MCMRVQPLAHSVQTFASNTRTKTIARERARTSANEDVGRKGAKQPFADEHQPQLSRARTNFFESPS